MAMLSSSATRQACSRPQSLRAIPCTACVRRGSAQQAAQLAWRSMQHGQQRRCHQAWALAASKKEDEAYEKMLKEIEAKDPLDNEMVGTALKVALVAAFVALSIGIANLGSPIIDNTINAFPTPQG